MVDGSHKLVSMQHMRKLGDGFTLVEVMLSVVFLGLIVSGITVIYQSGLQAIDAQDNTMLLDSHLQSRMEVLIGTDFNTLSDDSEVVAVNGQNYTINWTVVFVDLDGDSNPEPDAKQVTVSVAGLSGYSLTTLLVDHDGRLGKI